MASLFPNEGGGLQKRGHIEKHHGDDDEKADDSPEDVEPLIVFFLAKEEHTFFVLCTIVYPVVDPNAKCAGARLILYRSCLECTAFGFWLGLTTGYTTAMSRMLDIRERTRLRRMLYAKPTIILLAILVAVAIHGVWGIYQKSKEALAKRDKIAEEVAGLAAREKELHQDIARLKTSEGVEAEIRNRFMVAKEGEKVMIIANPSMREAHTVTITDDSPSFFEKVKGAVGF